MPIAQWQSVRMLSNKFPLWIPKNFPGTHTKRHARQPEGRGGREAEREESKQTARTHCRDRRHCCQLFVTVSPFQSLNSQIFTRRQTRHTMNSASIFFLPLSTSTRNRSNQFGRIFFSAVFV